MQPTRIFTILFLLGLLLTIVLSNSIWLNEDNNDLDLNNDNHAISKRILGHHHHGHHESDLANPRQCVRCKFSLVNCCSPNICVKRRFRTDKCLRVKG